MTAYNGILHRLFIEELSVQDTILGVSICTSFRAKITIIVKNYMFSRSTLFTSTTIIKFKYN